MMYKQNNNFPIEVSSSRRDDKEAAGFCVGRVCMRDEVVRRTIAVASRIVACDTGRVTVRVQYVLQSELSLRRRTTGQADEGSRTCLLP